MVTFGMGALMPGRLSAAQAPQRRAREDVIVCHCRAAARPKPGIHNPAAASKNSVADA